MNDPATPIRTFPKRFHPWASRARGPAPGGSGDDAGHGFAGLVGAGGWSRLPDSIRRRFATLSTLHGTRFEGRMEVVHASRIGLVLAQLYRLFGTPLAPFRGRDVPVAALVYGIPDGSGTVWQRDYLRPDGRRVRVRSTKAFTAADGLMEIVGGGFGMRLKVYEEGGRLHFLSTSFFWRLGKFFVPLPLVLTPGVAHVVHGDESRTAGAGWFRFTMTFDHPILGRTFHQDGLFREKERA